MDEGSESASESISTGSPESTSTFHRDTGPYPDFSPSGRRVVLYYTDHNGHGAAVGEFQANWDGTVREKSSTASEAPHGRNAFDRRVDEVKISKMDINHVIMDYLINEGYPDAAKKFAAEANIQHSSGDTENIQERVEIRNAILVGDIQTAIERINELNPELLDLNTALNFSLLRLQLIELIRNCTNNPTGDLAPVLTFASTHLAPIAPSHPAFLDDLEHTMALLIYAPDNLSGRLQDLLDPQLRQDVATAVNEAILGAQGFDEAPKLKGLVRLRAWSERRAREQKVTLPKTLDLWARETEAEHEDSIMGGNGDAEADPEAMTT